MNRILQAMSAVQTKVETVATSGGESGDEAPPTVRVCRPRGVDACRHFCFSDVRLSVSMIRADVNAVFKKENSMFDIT